MDKGLNLDSTRVLWKQESQEIAEVHHYHPADINDKNSQSPTFNKKSDPRIDRL